MKNWAGIISCLVALNQSFYIMSEVNSTIRLCLFIVQTSDRIYVIYFCHIRLETFYVLH